MIHLTQYLANWAKRIGYIGVAPTHNSVEKQMIILSNQITLILLLVSTLFALSNYIIGAYIRGLTSAIIIPFLFCLFGLNVLGRNKIMRVLVCLLPSSLVLIPSFLSGGIVEGTGKNYYIVLLGLSQISFVLFRGRKENVYLYTCLAFNLAYLFSYNIFLSFTKDFAVSELAFWVDKLKEMLGFFIVAGIVWFKTNLSDKYLEDMNELNFALTLKNEEIKNLAMELQQQNSLLDTQYKLLEHRNKELAINQEEISVLNADLEQKVFERTHQLYARNKTLEEYSFYVSHVLRAPLSGMLGMLNLLKMDYLQLSQPDFAQKLEESMLQMDNVIRDLNSTLRQKQL